MVTLAWNSAKERGWYLELEGQGGIQVLDWQIISLIIKVGITNLCGVLTKDQIPF